MNSEKIVDNVLNESKFQLVTPNDKIPTAWDKSIFLAGPILRDNDDMSITWQNEAIELLKKAGFNGVVFCPAPFMKSHDYKAQVDWENKCLNMTDCILFWIPRSAELPGFTTNTEFGEWMSSGKIVLGCPEDAIKVRYQLYKAQTYRVPVSDTLESTVANAVKFVGDGAHREDGETTVPIYIWKTDSFQSWYQNHKKLGNKLIDSHVEWVFKAPKAQNIFCWVVFANMYIAAEDRNKVNEFVLSRPDIAVIVACQVNHKDLLASKILLIKEFRTPVNTPDGFIHELPGGSTKTTKPMHVIARDELKEETGLEVDANRMMYLASRQLCGTLSAHKAHVFIVNLTDEEVNELANTKKTFGVSDDSEKTYLEVMTVSDIMTLRLTDWSMVGMIAQAIGQLHVKELIEHKE
ncbi:MAG: nucleoside 2-deoxyribosyltransferase domain-containing protein [Nitrosarchaeum sp.]|nr:nucleoside 2-deoxyribosyltransferase domain-containing protein [Nitrosarchaeum sp.]